MKKKIQNKEKPSTRTQSFLPDAGLDSVVPGIFLKSDLKRVCLYTVNFICPLYLLVFD